MAPLAWAGMTPTSAVSFGKALTDAETIASMNAGWKVARVEGKSMEPFFGDHSILVYGPENFQQIQMGMTVVFEDETGDLVAHRVVQQEASGLRTLGNNNFQKDSVLVTPANFRGVVIAVFHTSAPPVGTIYASDGQPLNRVYGKSNRG